MKLAHLSVLSLLCAAVPAWSAPLVDFSNVVFEQDFESSTNVDDFKDNASPDAGQFTQINDGSIVTAGSNNFLRIDRPSSAFQNTIRRANADGSFQFGLFEGLIRFAFDMRFDNVGPASGLAGALDLADDNAGFDTFSARNRLEWERAGDGAYRLRGVNQGSAVTATGFSRITIFGNKSGAAVDFIGPDGNQHTLSNDQRQVWLDDTLQIVAGVGSDGFEQLRIFHQAQGTIDYDNFQVATVVPEPSTFALGIGALGMLVCRRSRR